MIQRTNFMLSALGFQNWNDYLTTLFNPQNKLLIGFSFIFGANFKTHFWDNPDQIIFLWILLLIDLGTGIIKALKNKNFKSSKLPRWSGIAFTNFMLLFLSYNVGTYAPVLNFLPGSLYTIFSAVAFVSIVENLNEMGCLNIKVYSWLKKKIDSVISDKTE